MIPKDTMFEKTNAVLTMYQDMQQKQQDTAVIIEELKMLLTQYTAQKNSKIAMFFDNSIGKVIVSVGLLFLVPICGYFWEQNKTIGVIEKDYIRYEKIITENSHNITEQDKKIYILTQENIRIKERLDELEKSLKDYGKIINTPQNRFYNQGYTKDSNG